MLVNEVFYFDQPMRNAQSIPVVGPFLISPVCALTATAKIVISAVSVFFCSLAVLASIPTIPFTLGIITLSCAMGVFSSVVGGFLAFSQLFISGVNICTLGITASILSAYSINY